MPRSRSSSPAAVRAQIALHGTVSVPINANSAVLMGESNSSLNGHGSGNVSTGSVVASVASIASDPSVGGPPSRRYGNRRMSMQDAIDVSKFDMKLYSERRRKNTQTFSDAIHEESRENNEPAHLDFSLRYDKETRALGVHLAGASDLQALPACVSVDVDVDSNRDPGTGRGQLNPYCRLQLLPNVRAEKQVAAFQGKTHKSTSAPQFDEHFVFEVESSEIGLKVLQILILHEDNSRAAHVCIGHVTFSLSNLQFNQVLPFRRPIVAGPPTSNDTVAPSCILFSLAYLVGAERITVTITKVTNLRCPKGKVQCKITVTYPGGSPKKKKTSSMRVINGAAELQEAVTFSVNRKVIQQTKLHVQLVHKATFQFQKASVLGSLELGPDSTGYAFAHWNDMVNCKDSLPRWHQLTVTTEKNNNHSHSHSHSHNHNQNNSLSCTPKSAHQNNHKRNVASEDSANGSPSP